MFETLTERMGSALGRLRGRGRLAESNVREALREVRVALIEADVAVDVVASFTERVREKVLGQEVLKSLTPDQEVVRAVRDELRSLMGDENAGLALNVPPPAVFLVAGLQGTGKTTTVAKLARWLGNEHGRKVLVASCDVYRPAAIEQLRVLASQAEADFFPSRPEEDPVGIATRAIDQARRSFRDAVVLDTAGRMHVDARMMDEVRRIHAAAKPVETLFVVDSMTGQDAATAARAFDRTLPLSGVILTKTDGDARGGAALSVREVTGKPVKFLGNGEKLDAFQPFHPDRMASRILGMGDVLSLIEEAEQKIDRDKAQKIADKFAKGQRFDLEDFGEQIRQMRSMGGISSLVDKLPGAGQMPVHARKRMDDAELLRLEAIISSMTVQERRFPALIKGSRKRRIAAGSGTRVQDVNRLLKQLAQMQKMMKRMRRKGGIGRMMQGLSGNAIPGFPGRS